MASDVLNTVSKDWYERCRIASEEKYELDIQSKMAYAKQQGRQEIINELNSGKSLEQIIKENKDR